MSLVQVNECTLKILGGMLAHEQIMSFDYYFCLYLPQPEVQHHYD